MRAEVGGAYCGRRRAFTACVQVAEFDGFPVHGCILSGTVTRLRCAMYSRHPVRAGIAASFFVSVVLLSACRTTTPAADPTPAETGFLDRSIDIGTTTHRYQVYVPSNYTPSREWPLVLFLHGAGERGYEGLSQTHVGLGRAIRFNPERWPAVVVFPQLPPGGNWSEVTEPIGMQALQATMDEFAIDTSRVYLTGLSMGDMVPCFWAVVTGISSQRWLPSAPPWGMVTATPFLLDHPTKAPSRVQHGTWPRYPCGFSMVRTTPFSLHPYPQILPKPCRILVPIFATRSTRILGITHGIRPMTPWI